MASREAPQAYPVVRRTRRRRAWAVVVIAVVPVLAISGYLAAGYVVYTTLSTPPDVCHARDAANTPQSFVVPPGFDQAIADANRMPAPQDVELRSRDPEVAEFLLRGWWIPAEAADAPAVIVIHGIESCRREANVLIPAGMLHRHGYSVLLIDLRNHGDSDNHGRMAGGTTEYRDVLGAWDWLVARGVPAERIGVFAVSFGAATSIIAGGEEPRVAAVWADSAWARIEDALGAFLEDRGVPAMVAPGGVLAGRLFFGTDLAAKRPVDELARYAGRHVAFVNGTDDPTIAVAQAGLLRDAAVAAGANVGEYWIVPGAGHTESVYRAPDEYEARLVRFFDRALGGSER